MQVVAVAAAAAAAAAVVMAVAMAGVGAGSEPPQVSRISCFVKTLGMQPQPRGDPRCSKLVATTSLPQRGCRRRKAETRVGDDHGKPSRGTSRTRGRRSEKVRSRMTVPWPSRHPHLARVGVDAYHPTPNLALALALAPTPTPVLVWTLAVALVPYVSGTKPREPFRGKRSPARRHSGRRHAPPPRSPTVWRSH